MHTIDSSKSIQLHTRSVKFGKLGSGRLIVVNKVKRQKNHFFDVGG